jgi:hypothetical protein
VSEQGTITLEDGRTIHLRWFQQYQVYAGLLEGHPTREMNERMIRRLFDLAETRTSTPPYLVPPREKRIDYPDGYPFDVEDAVALPRIACLGHFESFSPARDASRDYSSLVIIWFQDDYAFPIEPEVLVQIRVVDWARLASDHFV